MPSKNPKLDRTPEEQEALYKAFARAYMDPTGPTYQNAIATYKLTVDPEPPEFSLRKQPYRFLNHRVTKTEMARIKTETTSIVAVRDGITLAEYVHECWMMGQLFKERGMIGDSTAATQAMKLVGQAMGYMAPKETTARPREQLTPGEALLRMKQQVKMLELLQESEKVPEGDYEILEATDGKGEGKRELARPDD